MDNMYFPNLFQPIKIGNVMIKNRIVHVPTDISSADADGGINERVIAYHAEVAKGGTGFIIVGASTPDKETGRPTVTCISVDSDIYIPGLHRLASAMQRFGAKCAVQIQHPGRQAAVPRYGQVSCSDMISDLPGSAGHEVVYAGGQRKGKIARAMTVEEIYDLIEKFAEAAWRVQQAGFDAVELHGAHGYLIAQFMSPYTNKRHDRFGGSLRNRMRFPLEIIARIKEKCGDDFPVLIRYSGDEWIEGGRDIEESKKVAKMFEEAGVAALDISAGIFDVPGPTMDPMYYPQGWNTYSAEAIKSVVKIPVITSHTLRDPEYCDRIIREGKTDMVGLSRQLVADPYWANKAKAGETKEIRKCISCLVGCWQESLMIKREMRCAINPAVGDMRFLNMKPARKSLRVAIIGGGPAGMEAARVATIRGHKVTIFEKDGELGGAMRYCCMVPGKQKMKWYMDWIRRQLEKLNVDVQLRREVAGPDDVKDFDVVLCGTGARTLRPDIPGIDRAVTFEDVMGCNKTTCEYHPTDKEPPVETGQRVLVWGDHFAAADTAEMLAFQGKEVTVVTEAREFASNLEPIHRDVLMKRLAGSNGEGLKGRTIEIPAKIFTSTIVREIGEGEVVVEDNKFRRTKLAIDTVVLAHTVPDNELYEKLLAAGITVANMGDSVKVRNVRGAVTDGADLGLTLDDDIFMNANGTLAYGLPLDVVCAK
ncbi:MAG: FAD-dependent oxidoreductase [Firmicutes bacterium]|nr:FAD-dependent oxidoreductase [Bacillota bacterium]